MKQLAPPLPCPLQSLYRPVPPGTAPSQHRRCCSCTRAEAAFRCCRYTVPHEGNPCACMCLQTVLPTSRCGVDREGGANKFSAMHWELEPLFLLQPAVLMKPCPTKQRSRFTWAELVCSFRCHVFQHRLRHLSHLPPCLDWLLSCPAACAAPLQPG